jgi:hypothetical protein
LAIVTTQEEADFVKGLAGSDNQGLWIGLSDPVGAQRRTGWSWVTGEPVGYVNWASERPIVRGPRAVRVRDKWFDSSMDEKYGFICEWDRLLPPAPAPASSAPAIKHN